METLTQSAATDTQDMVAILKRLEPLLGGVDVRLRRVEGEIGSLKLDVGTLKADVGTLKADVGSIGSRLQKIEVEALPGLRVEIAELKGRVTQPPTAIQLIGFLMAVLAIAGLTKVFSH